MKTRHSVDKETKEITFLVKQFVDAVNRKCSKCTNRSLHHTLNTQSQYSTIKTCQYYKGNGLAILNVSDYYTKLNSTIGDYTKI